jgi:hypothetical protein
MNAGMFILLFGNDPAMAQDCDELKNDMIALELFLQDKKDHTETCPKISWKQPKIDVYKKELKSQLPEGCKK